MIINCFALNCILNFKEHQTSVLNLELPKISKSRKKRRKFTHKIVQGTKTEKIRDYLCVRYDQVCFHQYCRYIYLVISLFSYSLSSIIIIHRTISHCTSFLDHHLWIQFFSSQFQYSALLSIYATYSLSTTPSQVSVTCSSG